MQLLEQRLHKLEKNIKIYRIVFGSTLCFVLAFILMSNEKKTSVPEKIQAKSFQVVNNSGNVLAELGTENNNGYLATYTPQGKKLVYLFTSDGGGGGLNTFDNDGDVNFKVTRTTDGGGYMALFNGDRTEIFEAGTTIANSGYLQVNDEYGQKLAWITFTEGGGGYFSLMGRNHKEYLRFSTPNAGGRIGVYNENDTRIGYLGAQENKDGNLTIYNSAGSVSSSLP